MTEDHEKYMKACIELARKAMEGGDPPFGAVLVREGKVIAADHNRTASENHFMRHAEINILIQALERFGPDVFSGCTLYSSNEPCPMCAGAIYWSGVRQVVYGMTGKALIDIRGWGLHASGHAVLKEGTDAVYVIGGVMEGEVRALHERFWRV